jgi:hypothetical protein
MMPEQPEVSFAADGNLSELRDLVGGVLLRVDKVTHEAVDLGGLETCNLQIEIALEEQLSELAQLGGKGTAIPAGIGRNLVVRQGESAFFSVAQSGHHDDRNVLKT